MIFDLSSLPSMLFRSLWLVAGLWWCWEVFTRRREHMELVRGQGVDGVQKGVVIGIWAVTLVIALTIVVSLTLLVMRTIHMTLHPFG